MNASSMYGASNTINPYSFSNNNTSSNPTTNITLYKSSNSAVQKSNAQFGQIQDDYLQNANECAKGTMKTVNLITIATDNLAKKLQEGTLTNAELGVNVAVSEVVALQLPLYEKAAEDIHSISSNLVDTLAKTEQKKVDLERGKIENYGLVKKIEQDSATAKIHNQILVDKSKMEQEKQTHDLQITDKKLEIEGTVVKAQLVMQQRQQGHKEKTDIMKLSLQATKLESLYKLKNKIEDNHCDISNTQIKLNSEDSRIKMRSDVMVAMDEHAVQRTKIATEANTARFQTVVEAGSKVAGGY